MGVVGGEAQDSSCGPSLAPDPATTPYPEMLHDLASSRRLATLEPPTPQPPRLVWHRNVNLGCAKYWVWPYIPQELGHVPERVGWGTGKGGTRRSKTPPTISFARAGSGLRSWRNQKGQEWGAKGGNSRAQSHKGAHHGRDDPGNTDWVPTASIWHAPPVQDVQAGI